MKMVEFPTYEEIGKKVAEKALDEILYDGKSIREWMQIIVSEDAISRDKAIVQLSHNKTGDDDCDVIIQKDIETLKSLPPITPQPCEDAKPAQVELEGDGYADGQIVYDWGKCPKCGWEFENGDKDWEEPYCCHCGQKLRWFEDAGGEE